MKYYVADCFLTCSDESFPERRTVGRLCKEMIDYLIDHLQIAHIEKTKNAELCPIKIKCSPSAAHQLLTMGINAEIIVTQSLKYNLIGGRWVDDEDGEYEDLSFLNGDENLCLRFHV